MIVWIHLLEPALKLVAGLAGLGTFAYATYNIMMAQRRPTGTTTGAAARLLRTPYLVAATMLFIIAGCLLWRPLPFQLTVAIEVITSLVGSMIFFPSLALYIWGLRSLGENFNASSGFGVRLLQSHQLVMRGPYQYIRHPMYLGVILACWGGLLIYLTWTMLGLSIIMLGVIFRARREEQALALEFGAAWEEYRQDVPGWFPRIK